jgi:hypothetical protein
LGTVPNMPRSVGCGAKVTLFLGWGQTVVFSALAEGDTSAARLTA